MAAQAFHSLNKIDSITPMNRRGDERKRWGGSIVDEDYTLTIFTQKLVPICMCFLNVGKSAKNRQLIPIQ